MSFINTPIIIGIDHGYGNIKTAHCCFKTGVTEYDKEPTFKSGLLTWGGRYFLIGEEHKEFAADKMGDLDYYVLTLAAIARELAMRDMTSARVHLAAGLPLTWVSDQKERFKAYLLQNDSVDFTFRGIDYHVEFTGADVFPQGFSAVVDRLRDFAGTNMLCDIGNGTMNVMYINERRPVQKLCFTEKYGTNQCMLAVRESLFTNLVFFVDDGWSGTSFERPGFQKMLEAVENDQVGVVITKDLSRFGRNSALTGMYINFVFAQHGVRYIAINDNYDTIDPNSVDNDFAGIKNWFNEFYARDTSRKIRAVVKAKGERGERLTYNPPYGYKKDPENPKQWIIDEEAAQVVRHIFALCMEGRGPSQIARQLEEEQILNPTFYQRKEGRSPTNPGGKYPYYWNSTNTT